MTLPERVSSLSDNPALGEDYLFRSGVVKVVVDVTPEWRRSPQGDLMLRGFIAEKEIEVVFPGRRRVVAAQLTQRLQKNVEQAKVAAKVAGRPPTMIRQKLTVDGVWRVRLLAEKHGMPVRRFQLVAARWRFRGADGIVHVDGEIPYG